MNITLDWLKKYNACEEGYDWASKIIDKSMPVELFLKKLMDENKFDWANWVIVRVFNRTQQLQYAIFAAEQVIDIFERKYPDDKRPRKTIEAAKEVLKNDTQNTRDAAQAAWDAAWDAGDAVWSALATALVAGDAARAAARDAGAATLAALAARDAARAAARDAARAATRAASNSRDIAWDAALVTALAARDAAQAAGAAAYKTTQVRILNYGVNLL